MSKYLKILTVITLVGAVGLVVLTARARDNADKQSLSVRVQGKPQVQWAVAEYRFAYDGAGGVNAGVAGVTNTIDLDVVIPDNAIVAGGFYEVITGLAPTAGTTNGLFIQSSGDLLANAAAGFESTGINELVPAVETPSGWIKLTDDRTLYLETVGAALTAGVFRVWIPYYMGL